MDAAQPADDDARIDAGALVAAVVSRWFRIVVITALLCGLTYAILYFVPRTYESTASILVETRNNAFTSPAAVQASQGGAALTLDAVISSEIELIRSRDTLMAVIDQLDLRAVPEFNGSASSPVGLVLQMLGRRPEARNVDQVALDNLRERLSATRERDSAIVSVTVGSQDPELAARIANAVANAHVARRASLTISDTAEASQWLEAEIVKLRERVTEAETAVANYRVANDLFQGPNSTSLVDQQLANLTTQVAAAQERRTAAQTRASLIRNLINQGQPIDGLPDVRDSLVVQQLVQSRADLQRQLAERSSTLLPNHPTVRALSAQVRTIDQQIATEGGRVAAALEAQATIEADLESSLQQELARIKQQASQAATDTVTLDGLQREAAAQRGLLESYLLRYRDALSRSESRSELPDVRVVSAAAPSSTPSAPKVGLTLGAVAFIAIAGQVGLIIFGALLTPVATAFREEVDQVRRVRETSEGALPAADPDEPMLPFEAPVADERRRELAAIAQRTADAAATTSAVLEAARSGRFAPDPAETAVVSVQPAKDTSSPVARAPVPPARASADGMAMERIADQLVGLTSDMALGRARVVLLTSIDAPRDLAAVAELLVEQGLDDGLSIAWVDAGTGIVSDEAGLTDLAAEQASFGDVVHRGERNGLAEIPWGTLGELDRASGKLQTLVEALTDIYDVVIVIIGRLGEGSSLEAFTGLNARVVLIAGGAPAAAIEQARREAAGLGFSRVSLVAHPAREVEFA